MDSRLSLLTCIYGIVDLKMSTPSTIEEAPPEDGHQGVASPTAAEFSLPDETQTDPYLSLMKEIADTHKEMRKAYLRHLISIAKNHNILIEDSIRLRQELTEINRRGQILQDWMMSPLRLVPLQALQDNSLNINDLQSIASETPSDNSCSVQLLELLDHSIANHFPPFEIPNWNSLHPEIPPLKTRIPPPSPSEDGAEDFTKAPECKHPNPVLEDFVSPSPQPVG